MTALSPISGLKAVFNMYVGCEPRLLVSERHQRLHL